MSTQNYQGSYVEIDGGLVAPGADTIGGVSDGSSGIICRNCSSSNVVFDTEEKQDIGSCKLTTQYFDCRDCGREIRLDRRW